MSRNNNYKIPTIDEDGENITITYIDPDLPYGKLEAQNTSYIENKWVSDNYPNMTKDQLSNMGVTIEFVEGNEVYELKDEYGIMKQVSKEEYFKFIDDYKLSNDTLKDSTSPKIPNETTINIKHISQEYDSGFGGSHNEPGRILVHVNSEQVSTFVKQSINTELSQEQVTKLDEFIEKVTGVKNTVLTGMNLKMAYSSIKKLLADEGIVTKNLQISGIVMSVALKPTMQISEMDNIWDADDSEVLKVVNKVSKAGAVVICVIGIIGMPIKESSSVGMIFANLLCIFIDTAIRDYDGLDIFKINDQGEVEYDFKIKNSSGEKVHYNGIIKLNYEDPQLLANQIYGCFEVSKMQMCILLDTMKTKRAEIIKRVKLDIEDGMYGLAYGVCLSSSIDEYDNKAITGICEVYGITPVQFDNPKLSQVYIIRY